MRILCAILLASVASGCTASSTGGGFTARLRENSPVMRRYQELRKACDPDGGDGTVKKTGCAVCSY